MFDLDQFVADCRAALTEHSPQAATRELVRRAVAQPGDVERTLGTPTEGKFVTLYHAPDLTILNLIWAPGMVLSPHDHRMWAVIGLYGGREDNTFYRRTPQGLVRTGGKNLTTADVVILGDQVIHAVTNPSTQFTGALHVYGGDFFATPRSEFDPDTFAERPFDAERVKRLFREANARVQAASGV